MIVCTYIPFGPQIKIMSFNAATHGGEVCTICLDKFGPTAEIRQLPCGHFFHKDCVDTWLLQNALTCPLCKRDVTTMYDEMGGGNEAEVTETTSLLGRHHSRNHSVATIEAV